MRHFFKAFIALGVCAVVLLSMSCAEKTDVRKLLSYEAGKPEYDISFCIGDAEYPMHIALEESCDATTYRSGSATLTDGILSGVVFDMKEEKLDMRVGELIYPLTQGDASALYSLFAVFALDENDLIGATTEDDGTIVARFEDENNITVIFSADTFIPLRAEIGEKSCTIVFVREGET